MIWSAGHFWPASSLNFIRLHDHIWPPQLQNNNFDGHVSIGNCQCPYAKSRRLWPTMAQWYIVSVAERIYDHPALIPWNIKASWPRQTVLTKFKFRCYCKITVTQSVNPQHLIIFDSHIGYDAFLYHVFCLVSRRSENLFPWLDTHESTRSDPFLDGRELAMHIFTPYPFTSRVWKDIGKEGFTM